MLRKTLLGMIASVWIATTASSQEVPVQLEVSGAFLTQYIWNGFDRVEARGLESGPVVQPQVTVGMRNSPLRAHVAGSFVVNEQSELHETIYGVSVVRDATPLTRLGLGYNYYDDRVALGPDEQSADAHEVWGSLEARSPVGSRIVLAAKWEKPTREGLDPFTLFLGELGYEVPLLPVVGPGGFGLDLDVSTNVIYTTGMKQNDVEVLSSGFTVWQMGAAASLKSGRVAVIPSFNYQVTLKDAVNDKNPVWGGVTVSYAF
ncbi:MAG: hypothetical protein JSW67_08555 [Candidatus Latescibacterota bacterium]|nr:MAG: hypothetical protein JSW67_08555 [Candidatus Latescibacterota bacterium]